MFEVDADALRERIRRASGNPYVRGLRFLRVELFPSNDLWWAGRPVRRARLHVSELDGDTLRFLADVSPSAYGRFTRLLAEILEVQRVELVIRSDGGLLDSARRWLFTSQARAAVARRESHGWTGADP